MSAARISTLLLGAACWAGAAHGCSLQSDALLPTNYELVRETATIVLARATGPTVDRADDEMGPGPAMQFAVLRTLRGTYPERTVALRGGGPFRGASSEDDFARARPGAFTGGCTAYDYRAGHLYVLFLDQSDRRWDLHAVAFSRVNEEVESASSPWVEAVTAYVRIAGLGDYEGENAALRELANTANHPLAGDIARHFSTPTHAKSETDLLRLYRSATSDAVRRAALIALARHGGDETTAIFRAFLRADHPPDWAFGSACDWAASQHATTELPFLLRRVASRPGKRWDALLALAALAGPGDADSLRGVLPTLADDEAEAFYRGASGLAGTPAALADLRRRLGGSYAHSTQLSLVLAQWGDRDVLEWAAGKGLGPGRDRWLAPYVLVRSPLAEAEEPLQRVAAGNDSQLLAALIDALAESARADRLQLVSGIVARRPRDQRVINAANRTLRALARAGMGGAQSLLATLPPEQPESY